MSVVTSTAHFHPRILQNLEGPVEIPHRSSFLPPIYLWVGQNAHPRLHTHSDREEYRRGRTYVVVVDIDSDSPRLWERRERNQGKYARTTLLSNGILTWNKGLLNLNPGDAVFVRDCDGTGDPMDDILHVFVVHEGYVQTTQM